MQYIKPKTMREWRTEEYKEKLRNRSIEELNKFLEANPKEERFALDNNDLIIDFEDDSPVYNITQARVCELLNEQNQEIAVLNKALDIALDEFEQYWLGRVTDEKSMTLKEYALLRAKREVENGQVHQ